MSIAQIPAGTILSGKDVPYDTPIVIPPQAIVRAGTLIPAPLTTEIDTRDPNNRKGVDKAPQGSTIPDGVFLPVGTFIPQQVPDGTILPQRTILPFGSTIPDKTVVPFGALVAEGTEIKQEQVGFFGKLWNWARSVVTDVNAHIHVPLGTRIEKGTVFPLGSVIVRGTRLQPTESNQSILVPPYTIVYGLEELAKIPGIASSRMALAQKKNGAALPEEVVVTNVVPERTNELVLPEGTVIPKFDDGQYAIILPGTVVPALANGDPSEIPENARIAEQKTEQNRVAQGTVVPAGAKIPPGTIIPPGGVFPDGMILFVPRLNNGNPAYVPPYTHIPVGAQFPESLAGTNMNIPAGTAIPSHTGKLQIGPEVEVPENFKFTKSIIENISVTPGTYIPRTDLPVNIPKGTIITSNTAWQSSDQTGTPATFAAKLFTVLRSDKYIKLMAMYIHVLLMLLAYYLASTRRQAQRAGIGEVLFALLIPELYLAIRIRDVHRTFPSNAYYLVALFVLIMVGITVWSAYNLKLQ